MKFPQLRPKGTRRQHVLGLNSSVTDDYRAERAFGVLEAARQLATQVDLRTRSTNCEVPFAKSSCSHMRRTRQPANLNVRVTSRSRAWFASSFFRQKAALLLGLVACSGQQCQKQPSTKIARRSFGKTKSGLPKTGRLRRQPVMRCARNNFASANSVFLLPRPRMRDITSERFALVKTSGIAT